MQANALYGALVVLFFSSDLELMNAALMFSFFNITRVRGLHCLWCIENNGTPPRPQSEIVKRR